MDGLSEVNDLKIIEIVDLNIEKEVNTESSDKKITKDLVKNNNENKNSKEKILLVLENLLLLTCFTIGIYVVSLFINYLSFLGNNYNFKDVKGTSLISNYLTIFVVSILGLRILVNLGFFVLYTLHKMKIKIKWVKICKTKLLTEQLGMLFSVFITLPVIVISLTKLMVECKFELSELGNNIEVLEAGDKLSNILFYYYLFLALNLLTELPIIRRHHSGNLRISKRIGMLDYTMSYIGNASLVASIVLYCFSYKYSDSKKSDPDLRSQVTYYYVTIVGVGVQSGIIAIIVGILGYIASILCSKMLILIALIVKFYSVFVFSWSCSLIWFGKHLLELFCNINLISPNLTSFPLQDKMAFNNACYTKPNFFLLSAFVIIQLTLSILTLIHNFVYLIKIRRFDSNNNK
ncbi:membrane associated protein [Cryptosporidium ryanae]|uniref:membrane associated protein n=1 Tax=Cryptosporidium ryanae TaxID=515981 RepID=UPI00351A9310|nr:membrane associated protein [Cryptosporidium ryanae]